MIVLLWTYALAVLAASWAAFGGQVVFSTLLMAVMTAGTVLLLRDASLAGAQVPDQVPRGW